MISKFLADKSRHLKIAKSATLLLENKFSIWKFKFGLDPILGIFPGVGDLVTSILSLYIVYIAILYGIRMPKVARMIFNILLDLAIGSIPILGDILDFIIKPNVKNLEILEKEIKSPTT